jgi:hypothetical protein
MGDEERNYDGRVELDWQVRPHPADFCTSINP